MNEYAVKIAPTDHADWTLTVIAAGTSKNDARRVALRQVRRYLTDRPVRIVRVLELV